MTEHEQKEPSTSELLSDYARGKPQQVLQFEAFPESEYGTPDWSAPYITWGPRFALEHPGLGVRVVISKQAPRDAAVRALKDIVGMLETCGDLDEHAPRVIREMARWFEQPPASPDFE